MTAPKLPEPFGFIAHPLLPDVLIDGWNSDQMRAYGLACALWAFEEAVLAVDDAGGDNRDYHAAAIRAKAAALKEEQG